MPMKSNTTMDHLAERVRDILGNDRRVTEKNMFGGRTFLLHGHILVGTKKDGRILLSVGKENFDAALARPGASPMNHTGRTMTGFVWVDADAIEDDDDLRDWVQTAYGWVSNMPADDPKAKAAARKAPAKKAVAKAPGKKAVPAKKPTAKKAVTKAPAKRAAARKAPARARP
jgi:TfoX/Sxy family transcriptional regulator of competence genes